MTCRRCGECCFPYSIGLDRSDDARRWLIYHGLVIRDGGPERMVLVGSSKCEMLVMNGDGTTACGVYADRPEICANYLCQRAQQE